MVVLDSQESESECEDEDEEFSNFQAAWFKAKDLEETKEETKTPKDDSSVNIKYKNKIKPVSKKVSKQPA